MPSMVESLKVRVDEVNASPAGTSDEPYGVCSLGATIVWPERMETRPISRLCVICKSARA